MARRRSSPPVATSRYASAERISSTSPSKPRFSKRLLLIPPALIIGYLLIRFALPVVLIVYLLIMVAFLVSSYMPIIRRVKQGSTEYDGSMTNYTHAMQLGWGSLEPTFIGRWKVRLGSIMWVLSLMLLWPLTFILPMDTLSMSRPMDKGSDDAYATGARAILYPTLRLRIAMIIPIMIGITLLTWLLPFEPSWAAQGFLALPLLSLLLFFSVGIIEPNFLARSIRTAEVQPIVYFLTTSLAALIALTLNLALFGIWSGVLPRDLLSVLPVINGLFNLNTWDAILRSVTVGWFDVLLAFSGVLFFINVVRVVADLGFFTSMKATTKELQIRANQHATLKNYPRMKEILGTIPRAEHTADTISLYSAAHLGMGEYEQAFNYWRKLLDSRDESIDDIVLIKVMFSRTFDYKDLSSFIAYWVNEGASDAHLAMLLRYVKIEAITPELVEIIPPNLQMSRYTVLLLNGQNAEANEILRSAFKYPDHRFGLAVFYYLLLLNNTSSGVIKSADWDAVVEGQIQNLLNYAYPQKNDYQRVIVLRMLITIFNKQAAPHLNAALIDKMWELHKSFVSKDHPLLETMMFSFEGFVRDAEASLKKL